MAALLKNHNVAGLKIFMKKDKVTGRTRPESDWVVTHSHEPIISEEVFNMIQQQLQERTHDQPGSPKSKWLLTGLLFCAKCGGSMQIETGKSGRYSYYNCRNFQKKHECESRRISARALDNWVADEIVDRLITPRMLAEMIVAMNKGAEKMRSTRSDRLARCQSELATAQQELEDTYDAIIARSFPDELLRPRLDKAFKAVEKLKEDLARIEVEKDPSRELTDTDAEDIREFISAMFHKPSNPQRIREFMATFIERIEVGDDKLEITYRPENIVNIERGGVPSNVKWLPDRSVLGTRIIVFSLPIELSKAA